MPRIADLSRPLSDDELDRLETILLERVDEDAVTDDADEGVLGVSELDGLLTAVVSGPVTIVPSRWLPAVWGDFEPTWNNLEEYQEFMSLVLRHMNDIAAALVQEPQTFEPIYLENVVSGDAVVIVDEWCQGYLRGVALAADEWDAAGACVATRGAERAVPLRQRQEVQEVLPAVMRTAVVAAKQIT
jgi:uncharacterized protein